MGKVRGCVLWVEPWTLSGGVGSLIHILTLIYNTRCGGFADAGSGRPAQGTYLCKDFASESVVTLHEQPIDASAHTMQVSALAPPRPGAMLEGDKGEAQANSGFLSKLVACKPDGKVMDFTVNTPVNRIPTVSPDQQRSRGGRVSVRACVRSCVNACTDAKARPPSHNISLNRLPRYFHTTQPIRQASDVISGLQDASPIETAPSTLVRQQADVRVSKARSFLRDDGTILTVWVSADRSAWADPDASASLSAILASFQP